MEATTIAESHQNQDDVLATHTTGTSDHSNFDEVSPLPYCLILGGIQIC